MSEPEFNIDAAADQFDAGKDLPLADVEELDADGNAIPDEDGDALPPGFKNYQDYIADGGDPDMYRGRKAYVAEHDRIEQNKSLKREMKGLRETVQQTVDAVGQLTTAQRAEVRKEVAAELKEAMENEDPQAAVDAQKKLDAIDDAPAPVARPAEHPLIAEFREENPMADPQADEFDEEFNSDVEGYFNGMAKELGGKLTDGQVKRCLKKALKQAQDLHEIDTAPARKADDDTTRGESPRNSRRGQTRSQRRASADPADPKAEDYVLDNPRNPSQKNAASDVRETIRKRAHENAIKSGKSEADAKKYADTAAKNFEKSLAK